MLGPRIEVEGVQYGSLVVHSEALRTLACIRFVRSEALGT